MAVTILDLKKIYFKLGVVYMQHTSTTLIYYCNRMTVVYNMSTYRHHNRNNTCTNTHLLLTDEKDGTTHKVDERPQTDYGSHA